MAIKAQLQSDVKNAMKSGEKDKRDVIRSLLAAIKQVEIDDQVQLDDAGVLAVITKQAKQHRESIVDFEKGGRDNLVAEEQAILKIIDGYLPQQMSEADVRAQASATIAELGATNPKAMGQVMNALMGKLKGQADGKLVSKVVRELLVS